MGLWERLFPLATHRKLDEDEKAMLRRLADRMADLEKQDSKREIEWTMWYDKFRTLFMRLTKRVERAEQLEGDAPQSRQDAPGTPNNHSGGNYAPSHVGRVRRNY